MALDPSPFPPASWAGIDDVVIVGGGLAGLFCALKLSPRPVTVIAPAALGEGAAYSFAQGGIAAAVAEGDTIAAHVADMVTAGAGLADVRMAGALAGEAARRVHDLLGYGVPFDRTLEGALEASRAATHSQARIVRVRGDTAGQAIIAALVAAVRRTPTIRVLEGFVAERLRTEGPYVTGLVARDKRGGLSARVLVATRAVVLASGGIGHLFEVTTNPSTARGEGLAMAARAGALVADAEFVQFHPTALDIGLDPSPLATEALRSEGAAIIDRRGERFMRDVHADADLAPRDIIARAVHEARASGRGAFLDCRPLGDALAERFPTVAAACRGAGFNPAAEPIPIAPAAHYHMGGVHVDGVGRSSLDGLWACGEVAGTGAHGANRLAGNALLEAVVFAARVAEDIHGLLPNPKLVSRSHAAPEGSPRDEENGADAIRRLRAAMSRHVGVVRDRDGLTAALNTIEDLLARAHSPQLVNACTAAKLMAAAALRREESRGAHVRSDFPRSAPALAKRAFLRLHEADRIAGTVRAQERMTA